MTIDGLTADFTYNTDFAQVEVDEQQINLDRFNLFFPEKRPFFLEGIELFSTPNQLVYTRRIVDPIAGAKLTGKVGPFAIAHLTAVDQDVDAEGRFGLIYVLFNTFFALLTQEEQVRCFSFGTSAEGREMLVLAANMQGVLTPEDAYRCFMRTNMDCLVIENYLLLKSEQPQWDDDKSWLKEFELD